MPIHLEHESKAGRSTSPDASRADPAVSEGPTSSRVVPVAGLVSGAGPAVVRRRGETSDPLGGTAVSPELDGLLSRRQGRGEPLPAGLARPMGEALGADLDAVRIHTGDEPAQLARSLQARAFSRGADIYFGAGSYAPHTTAGQLLLAHELAHTVQRGAGGGSAAGSIIGRAADPAEAEADRVADGVMQVLRRSAIRHPDSAPSGAPGYRPPTNLDALRRTEATGVVAGPEPDRADHRSLEHLRRVSRTSPDLTEPGAGKRWSADGWEHLRRPTPQQGPAAGSTATTVTGSGSTGRQTPIRRFYAVVREPQEGIEYQRVGTVPYVWINDADFNKKDWVISDVVTGWTAYNLYEWSKSKIEAEVERKAAEAAVLKQQEELAAAAQKKLEDQAAEVKRKKEDAEAEQKLQEQLALAAVQRKREEDAAEAQRVTAQQAEEKKVADERARATAEKKRLAAERVAAEQLAAVERAEEKKRKALEREALEKATAAKKAEDKKKRAAEKELADKKLAVEKAAARAEAQRVAAAREAETQEKARRQAAEKKAAEEKAAAEREVAEQLRVEQERLAAEAAKVQAKLLADAKEKERADRALAEETAIAEARAKKAAREEEARLKREVKARVRAEARARADEEARAKAEERARADAEAKAKAEAEERVRLEAEEKAREEARVAAEAEAKAKAEAAEKAKAAVTGPSPVAEGSDALVAVVDPVASSPVVPVSLGADYDPLAHGADQKFGNEPFSFDITTENPAVKAHLGGLFAGLKAETSKSKNTKLTDLFAEPHFAVHKSVATAEQKKARTQAVKGPYPKLIRHGPIDKRLEAAPAFAAKYELRADAADKKKKSIIDKSTGEAVGVLLVGIADAFANTTAQPGRRQGMTKKHKLSEDATHVVDSAGVPTRRFAYFETSRQQLMDGLGPSGMGALRGRYPRFRDAMGLPSTLNKIDRNDASVAQMYGGVGTVGDDGTVTVPLDVMAHTHQYLGNGLNQRGISLASTKKEQVYSNDGDPFKSDDGVRIKVDLALVPEDVILFNHYAEGGVGSRLAKNPAFPKGMLDTKDKGDDDGGRAYAYANSVVKNRELLLEKLQPEWIVELTDHLQDSMAGSGGPTGPLKGPGDAKGMDVDQLKAAVGFDAYERGRADVKAGKEKDTTLTGFEEKNYNLGWSTGNEEVLGAKAANDDCRDFWAGFVAHPLPPETPVVKTAGQRRREKEAKSRRPAPDVSTARAFGALSAEKIIDRAERLRLQTSKPAWYVLAQLRFVKINEKLFRPTMHDSFWLAWAAAMKTPPTTVVAASTVPREGAGVENPVLTT